MPTLRIEAELGLVDCCEGEFSLKVALVMAVAPRHWHALGRAQEIARLRWDDSFLARQQGDLLFALHTDDAVIDLTREQPQWEADHARGMAAHPLDREMGLARIGRPEDGSDRSV